jgi:hypothetical protein
MKEYQIYHSYWRNHWWIYALLLVGAICLLVAIRTDLQKEVLVIGVSLLAVIVIVFPGRAMIERKNGTPVLTVRDDRLVHCTRRKKTEYLFSEVRRFSTYEIKSDYKVNFHVHYLTITYKEELVDKKMAEADKSEKRRMRRIERLTGAHCLIETDNLTQGPEYIYNLVKDYYKKFKNGQS